MNPEKIGPLYEELSKHFGVPMIEWRILPKPKIQTRFQVTKKVSPMLQVRSTVITEIGGRFIEDPIPIIVFFGAPKLRTVMHEFMHYLVYCTGKGKKKK